MIKDKCSFILPTMNVEKSINSLLSIIYKQEYQGAIEVVLMDSSTDKTAEIARSFPIKYIWVDPADYNYGKTRNEGSARADGEFLIFLSTDIGIADNKWLSKLIGHFSDSSVAGVFGRQIPWNNASPMEQFTISYAYPPQSATLQLENGKLNIKKPVYFSNVNSAVRRCVWEKIKFPEMLANEDLEWARLALQAGYKIIYDGSAAVSHSHNRSLKGAFQWYFDVGAGMTVSHANSIIRYSRWQFISDGLKFVANEYKFMIRNGYWYMVPYAVVYDITKYLGTLAGSKQKYMPVWMKRALSKKKDHWDKYTDVIKAAV